MHLSLPSSDDLQLDDLEQIQADSMPPDTVQPITTPVVPPADQSIEQQQAHLIRELGKLNTQTDDLMLEQPSLEGTYQQHLAATFADLPRPINPNQIFYTRYRADAEGQQQRLSCETLGSLLSKLRTPGQENYLTQETGAFYQQANTLAADKRLSPIGSVATLASVLEIAFTKNLNEFWTTREDEQPNTEEQLVALRRQVLAHQLALRTVDGTLSAAGRTLADNVLKYPTAATREKVFPTARRPGVYRLALEDGSEFAAAFIMNAAAGTPPAGNVMLYTPGEGFEDYESLARLNETVAARIRDDAAPGKLLAASLPATARATLTGLPALAASPSMIEADVIADSVRALRVRQHFSVREALRKEALPTTGELDLAADLTPQLDVTPALEARNLRLLALREPDWLNTAGPADQAHYKALEKALIDSNEVLVPLLEKISTLDAFSAAETDKLLKIQKPAYADVQIAPHKSLVRLRLTSAHKTKVTGYRDDATGVVYICEDPKIDIPAFLTGQKLTKGTWETQVIVDVRTLGSYARRNVDPWSVHELHRTINASADIIDTSGEKRGQLDDADLRALAQQADIGTKYDAYLRSAFSQSGEGSAFATAWQRANAAKMHKDAFESRLNPAANKLFIFKTPGSGLDWIKAVVDQPDSATRLPVGRFDIEANVLVLGSGLEGGRGGQDVNGVLVIARKNTGIDGVSVLYTPDAPDGMPFRELVNGLSELDTLKAKPEWRAYFTRRMATNDASELARIFSDTHSLHRHTLTPITGNVQAHLYAAQLSFQLAHADYRSRTNAEVSRESAVNVFMFSFEATDFLAGMLPGKASLAFLRRGIIRGLRAAQNLRRSIPGLVKKIGADQKLGIAIGKTSIRPLEPAWVNVAAYRLPVRVDPLFDVEVFAQANNYTLSRSTGAPCFIDNPNNQFIAMRDQGGRYYLYSSYVQDGARYVKDPAGTQVDFMVVPGDAKSWKPRFERNSRGGGPVVSTLLPRTLEQQVDDDLIAALRIHSSEEEIQHFVELFKELTGAQKRRLLDNAQQQLGAHIDDAAFRRWVSGQRGLSQSNKSKLRDALLSLRSNADIFIHLNSSTKHLNLSTLEKDQLHLKIKRIIGKNDDFSKYIRASIRIEDPDTGAQFVGYAITHKQLNSLNRFEERYNLSTWATDSLNAFTNEKGRRHVLSKIASDNNITPQEALEKLLSAPQIREELKKFRTETFKAQLNNLGVDSFSEDFKKSGVPYIALSHGKQTGIDSGVKMVDSVTVTDFEKNLSRFSEPLEFSRPRVQTHRVEKPTPSPDTPAIPTSTATSDAVPNLVKTDDLANTQIPLLPENARTKLEEIVQDIQAGRVSRKKIGNYTYVDLPQVEAGSGRGKWRAAFEQIGKEGEQDVFILRGIIDYHASKLKAWGI